MIIKFFLSDKLCTIALFTLLRETEAVIILHWIFKAKMEVICNSLHRERLHIIISNSILNAKNRLFSGFSV